MFSALRLLILLPAAAMALDLTPTSDVKEQEGFKFPRLKFKDGVGKVTYTPPNGWRMSFEDGTLVFIPKEKTHASFEMRVVPRTGTDMEPFAKTEALIPYAAKFLPKLATEIAYTGTNQGTFTINGLPSREFLLQFQEPGHPTHASLNVIDLNDRERLIIVITAQPRDFEEVRGIAVQSLFSWQKE